MRAFVASIAVAAASLVAAPVRADPAEQAALVHLDRGVAAFRARDYTGAHREFAAASELAPDRPNPYRWLALTEVQLGDCQRAVVHAGDFLSRVRPDDPRAAELVRVRELCQRTGVLKVDSTPASAALRIDDAQVGRTPYRALSMRAGTYRLVAEKPGYRPAGRSVVVEAGGERVVHLDLAPASAPASRPITRRWWFWPAVVGAAAAITATVLIASSGSDDEILPPIRCDASGCAPGVR
ncbi:MAG TPA: PEGA domain-containing protein [Kofleriaceae bacterium]|nr:PEGA domain-containing protein [Kofleriaceae bacterium]